MDSEAVARLKQHLEVEPHKRKPVSNSFITSFLSQVPFFQDMLKAEGFSNRSQYVDLLSYYLKYSSYKSGDELTELFEEHSFIYVLTGSLRRIEYDQDPETVRKLFEEKINYHRDKMYWKKELMLLWTQNILLLGPGDVHLTEDGKQARLVVDGSADTCEIVYITAQKLRDAEILRDKSMRNETNFLKSTIFWKKCDIEELRQIVIRCSHELYDPGEYVYRENDAVHCVYVVRQGEFLYEKTVEVQNHLQHRLKVVKISKLVQGEVIGYNQILESNGKRQFGLKCCSEVGELYILPMDYWEELYRKFNNEFNHLHRKCLNFRQKEARKRVKSIQENPQLALGRKKRLVTEDRAQQGVSSHRRVASQEPRSARSDISLPQLKQYRMSIGKPRQLKAQANYNSISLFVPDVPKQQGVNNYGSRRLQQPQLTSYNSMFILKRRHDRLEEYRLKLKKEHINNSLEIYKSRNRRLKKLQESLIDTQNQKSNR